jgi:hypothetical protein
MLILYSYVLCVYVLCVHGASHCSWGTCETVAALGQNGSTWQPVARRVSGLKKAVMVATAGDHTVSATYDLSSSYMLLAFVLWFTQHYASLLLLLSCT